MKKLLIAAFAVMSLMACKQGDKSRQSATGFSATDINDAKVKDLPGAWMLKEMKLAAVTANAEVGNAFFENAREKSQNSIMVLSSGGNFFTTSPGQEIFKKWEFKSPNLVALTGGENTSDIEIATLTADSLTGSYELINPQTNKHVAKVNAVWSKLPSDGAVSWTDSSLFSWKTRATASENPEQVKARLKSLLNYNHLLAGIYARDTTQRLNPNIFQLPFEYYSGSVALKQENPEDNFARLFYSGNNAHTAFEQLRAAFKKAEFPKTGNYIAEYAEFFKRLANAL